MISLISFCITISVATAEAQCDSSQVATHTEMIPPSSSDKLLHGIHVALVTPFDKDGELNLGAVAPLVSHFVEAGIEGFYLCGSTGEGFAMTIAERKAMTAEVMKQVKKYRKPLPVSVHVGACALEDAVDLAKHAKEVGAHAVSSVAPGTYKWVKDHGNPSTVAEMVTYFQAVAAATDLPFYAYWLGASIPLGAAEFLDLMEGVPNFKGMKYTTGDMYTFQQIKHLSTRAGLDLNLVTGSDEINLAGAVMGSDGAIGSTYNVMPRMFVGLRKAFDEGRVASAMQLQQEVNEVIALMIERAGCKERGTNIINAHKAALRAIGLDVGFPRALSLTRGPWTPEQSAAFMQELAALPFKVE